MTLSILIVDDEPSSLVLLRAMVRARIPDATIQIVSDGTAALKWLECNAPSIVMLDLAMPVTNGNMVIEYIRTQSWLSKCQIMVVTAQPDNLEPRHRDYIAHMMLKPIVLNDIDRMIQIYQQNIDDYSEFSVE
jgi:CheY-like chemotaxis protein